MMIQSYDHGRSGGVTVGGDACKRGVVLNFGCDRTLGDRAGCAESSKLWYVAGLGRVCRARARFAASLATGDDESLGFANEGTLRCAADCSGM